MHRFRWFVGSICALLMVAASSFDVLGDSRQKSGGARSGGASRQPQRAPSPSPRQAAPRPNSAPNRMTVNRPGVRPAKVEKVPSRNVPSNGAVVINRPSNGVTRPTSGPKVSPMPRPTPRPGSITSPHRFVRQPVQGLKKPSTTLPPANPLAAFVGGASYSNIHGPKRDPEPARSPFVNTVSPGSGRSGYHGMPFAGRVAEKIAGFSPSRAFDRPHQYHPRRNCISRRPSYCRPVYRSCYTPIWYDRSWPVYYRTYDAYAPYGYYGPVVYEPTFLGATTEIPRYVESRSDTSVTGVAGDFNAMPPLAGQSPIDAGDMGPQSDAPTAGAQDAKQRGVADPLMDEGFRAFREGRYDAAQGMFLRAALAERSNGYAALMHALSSFALGEHEIAAASLMNALDDAEELITDPIDVRMVYGDQGDFANQLAMLESEVHVNPPSFDLQLLLGYLYYSSGDPGKAVVSFGEAGALDPGDPLLAALRQAALTVQSR